MADNTTQHGLHADLAGLGGLLGAALRLGQRGPKRSHPCLLQGRRTDAHATRRVNIITPILINVQGGGGTPQYS